MPVAFARYLSEFGMEPLLLDVQDFHREDAGYAKTIKERGFDPPVCHIMYRDRDVLIIRDLHPDIATCTPVIPVENPHQLDGGRGFRGVWGVRGNGERCSGFGMRQIGVKILTPRIHGLMTLGKPLHLTDVSLCIYRPR